MGCSRDRNKVEKPITKFPGQSFLSNYQNRKPSLSFNYMVLTRFSPSSVLFLIIQEISRGHNTCKSRKPFELAYIAENWNKNNWKGHTKQPIFQVLFLFMFSPLAKKPSCRLSALMLQNETVNNHVLENYLDKSFYPVAKTTKFPFSFTFRTVFGEIVVVLRSFWRNFPNYCMQISKQCLVLPYLA